MPDLPQPALTSSSEPETPIGPGREPQATTTDSPTIGEELRRARERSGKPLTQFSLELKIAAHHLIAIENDAFQELPGQVYAIGFVKSYATRLGLDSDGLVARLKAELAGQDVTLAVVPPPLPIPSEQANGAVPEIVVRSTPERPASLSARPERPTQPGQSERVAALFTRLENAVPLFARIQRPAQPDRGTPLVAPAQRPVPPQRTPLFVRPERPDARIDRAEHRAPLFARPERTVPVNASPDLTMRPWIMAAIIVAALTYFGYSIISSAGRVSPPPVSPVPSRLAAETGHVPRYTGPAQPVTESDKSARIAREQSFATVSSAALPPVASTEEPKRKSREPQFTQTADAASQPVAKVEEPQRPPREQKLTGTAGAAPPPVAKLEEPQRPPREPKFAGTAVTPPRPVATTEEQARIARDLSLAPAIQPSPPPPGIVEGRSQVVRGPAFSLSPEITPPDRESTPTRVQPLFDEPLPHGETYGEQNRGSRITLRVHRSTLVAVLGNRNHVYIERVLRPGDTYHVPNMRGLKLNAADAGAVELMVDNRTVGFAGEDGVAARGLPLQPQSIANRNRLRD